MRNLLPNHPQNSGAQQSNFLLMILAIGLMFIWMNSRTPRPPEKVEDRKPGVSIGKQDELQPTSRQDTTSDAAVVEATQVRPTAITLGSLDPNDPYRMLVTLTNRGAAVSRIELGEERYRDVQDASGYLGQIVADLNMIEEAANNGEEIKGCPVQVVGAGTPAAKAGLLPGDVITVFQPFDPKTQKPGDTQGIDSFVDLRNALLGTKPGATVRLHVQREGKKRELDVKLAQAPIDVVRPETTPNSYESYIALGGLRGFDSDTCDQLSFLTTLYRVDDAKLGMPESFGQKTSGQIDVPRDPTLDDELMQVELRRGCWELLSATRDEAVFRKTVPRFKLEIIKRFRLESTNGKKGEMGAGLPYTLEGIGPNGASVAYHLTLSVEIRNLDSIAHTVAYQLDGPTGAPLEGAWYSRKAGPNWGMYGVRDVVVHLEGSRPEMVSNNVICYDGISEAWKNVTPHYIGVDSTYFQCTLKPWKTESEDSWVSRVFPLRVGKKVGKWSLLTNNSFRIVSAEKVLAPASDTISGDRNATGAGNVLRHDYTIFAGPKNPEILGKYGLAGTLSYGWFAWFVEIMLGVLHFFHGIGLGYGIAIILLTIVVRVLISPLSFMQAKSAIKMQRLTPEIAALKEKYKDDPRAMLRAQSELWKKHKVHPSSGCLGLFIQIPIFVALYKALSVDVELYGASLFGPTHWCNDLSAPDMLFFWGGFWNTLGLTGFNTGQGMLYLGPYFNLLPMLTVVLFLVQQWVMLPPPTDDQTRMQRTMMNFMMPMMGLLFFKMPSGLCVYFIVSTLWGLAERQFVPKPPQPGAPDTTGDVIDVAFEENKQERADSRAKKRDRPAKPEKNEPPKEEGYFRKLWREVNEKASEQRKLGKAKEKTRDRRKKK